MDLAAHAVMKATASVQYGRHTPPRLQPPGSRRSPVVVRTTPRVPARARLPLHLEGVKSPRRQREQHTTHWRSPHGGSNHRAGTVAPISRVPRTDAFLRVGNVLHTVWTLTAKSTCPCRPARTS